MAIYQNIKHLLLDLLLLDLAVGGNVIVTLVHGSDMLESDTAIRTVGYARSAVLRFGTMYSAVVLKLSLLLFLHFLTHILQLSLLENLCTRALWPFPSDSTLRFAALEASPCQRSSRSRSFSYCISEFAFDFLSRIFFHVAG